MSYLRYHLVTDGTVEQGGQGMAMRMAEARTRVAAGFLAVAVCWMAATIGPNAAAASVLIEIDKAAQRMSVSVNGVPKYFWPVSTGASGYSTPSGSYQPFRMELDHFSEEWDDAPMPHSIFFTRQGHAIHGTTSTRNLGRPVSHGCVRLSKANAATLYRLVEKETIYSTQIVIRGPGSPPVRSAKKKKKKKKLSPLWRLYNP